MKGKGEFLMKKLYFKLLPILGLAFLFVFTGCNDDVNNQTKNAMAVIAAKNTGVTTVTFNTSHGTNVAKFDNSKKKIISSSSLDKETGLVTTRSYDYDSENNIRMLNIKRPYAPETVYLYGVKEENVTRSASTISEDIIDTPVKVRTVSKSVAATTRSAGSEETLTTEYYCDEAGNIVAVIQKDSYGNIKMKSATGE